MARGLVSFLGGLGQGGLDEWRRQEKQERADRLQALQEQYYQGRLDDAERARVDEQALRETAKPVEVEPGFRVQDAFTKDQDAADVMADMAQTAGDSDASQRPAARVRGVGSPRLFEGDGSGLDAARQYADEMNTPAGEARRYADTYKRLGRPDKAMEYELEVEKFNQAKQAFGIKALGDQALRMIDAGDFSGAAKLAKGLNMLDGGDINVTPDGSGGGVVNITNAQGNLVSQTQFRNADELKTMVLQQIDPWTRVQSQAKAAEAAREQQGKLDLEQAKARFGAEADIAKERAKMQRLGKDDTLVDSSGRVIASNVGPSGVAWNRSAIEKTDGYKRLDADVKERVKNGQITHAEGEAEVDRYVAQQAVAAKAEAGVPVFLEGLRRGDSPETLVGQMQQAGVADDVIQGVVDRVSRMSPQQIQAGRAAAQPTTPPSSEPVAPAVTGVSEPEAPAVVGGIADDPSEPAPIRKGRLRAQIRILDDRIAELKGPWYMPTPPANADQIAELESQRSALQTRHNQIPGPSLGTATN